jgi:UDP-N-acetylmuramate dehydrogenase
VSRWRVGGSADCIVTPSTTQSLAHLIQYFQENHIPYVVLGSSTNLLFADEGLRAVGIHIGKAMSDVRFDGQHVTAQSGIYVPRFAHTLAQKGLSGAEHICGIPGTLGGLICMNGGSQRKGIGEVVETVTSVDLNGRVITRTKEECGFAYRTSIYQDLPDIIVEATFCSA